MVLGVVIISYNTRALLHDCLHSLQACRLPLRIVVVDNGSHDGSADMVRSHFAHVEVREPGYNAGFAAANNIGLRLLGFGTGQHAAPAPDAVLLLNPDTIVQPGAIETLVAFLAAHPRVGVAAPRLLNADGSLQAGAFRFPTLSMSLLDVFPPGEVLPGRLHGSWWHGRYPQEHGTEPFPIDHPLGAALLVRGRVLHEVGLLDEAYFMYCEEIAWCWRIRQAGWAIWQVPAARVVHLGGAATQQVRSRMFVALHHSRMHFFEQHYSRWFVRAHRAITRAGMVRATLQAWYVYARRTLSRQELCTRLWAYGVVARR